MSTTRRLTAALVGIALAAMGSRADGQAATVDRILEQYVQALGGRAAIEKIKTRVVKGTGQNLTRGSTLTFEIYAEAPNKRVQYGRAIIEGNEIDVSRGFNGAIGWSYNMTETGFRELTDAELVAERREADFYRDIKLKELYPTMALKGQQQVGGRAAYVLEATPSGGDPERWYFDVETSLLIRKDVATRVPAGGQVPVRSFIKVPVELSFEDYREVDGIKVPFTIRRSAPASNNVTRYTEVRHNVPIDAAKFRRPRS